MDLKSFLLVGSGGAIGSMVRYGFALIAGPRNFPYSTLLVNIIGCFIIGIIFGMGLKNDPNNYWKFFAIGICGGFTTFSAFSLESVELLQQNRYFTLALYISISILIGILLTFAGIYLGRNFIK